MGGPMHMGHQGGRGGYRGGGYRGGRGGGQHGGGYNNGPSFAPGRPTAQPSKEPIKFDKDYDFDTANEEFAGILEKLQKTNLESNKDGEEGQHEPSEEGEIARETDQAEQALEKETYYDKKKSFFDSISCEATEKAKSRPDWRAEKKLNKETFGVSGGGYGRGGGRGGYRGRGYNRGYGGGGYYNNRGGYYNRGEDN